MNRVLGLDVGSKRIGISMSDALLFTAQPVETISREPEPEAIAKIKEICHNNDINKIIIGLPKHMNNTIGEQAHDCMDFSKNFEEFEIIFEDERLTSKQAENILALQGKKYTRNKQLVDLKSACIILQQYLDRK
ncbi:MAG: Holliday junction resolvase RuvX [Candidatus Gastranaerophilales bacterium]|nr:Holliday junction resolvase RuvX [Candidatus Gastranaerophilales bacterium]